MVIYKKLQEVRLVKQNHNQSDFMLQSLLFLLFYLQQIEL